MNLQEQIQRIQTMMGLLIESENRITFDMQELLDKGIIFITQAHDLKTGKMIPPEMDPRTGDMFHDSTNLITLWNILHPEPGEQEGIPNALKHPRPDRVKFWQERQGDLSQEKYEQIIRSIKLKEKEESSDVVSEEVTETEVKCDCGWSWKLSDGGNDPYICHKCGTDNTPNKTEMTERCWKGYTQKGMKTMFGKRYPNCVKKTNK